ncbi:MAG: sensor histidine kinase [Armatimonadetes bacterium]|nr:sensor histidine kinase [Armatimonadota bacterium]
MALPKTRYFPLRHKLALLSFVSAALAVLIGGLIITVKISGMLEAEMGNRALAIARTLAQMEIIQTNVGRAGGEKAIQPIAEKTRLATGVDYIVVVDLQRIRYSHPVAERIGKLFEDEDIGPALHDHEYVSYTAGVMGPSVRAFVPVKTDEGTRQVGVVVVGVLTPSARELLGAIQPQIYPSLAVGLLVGVIGSLFLANRIKGAMFGMEPEEIGRLLEERNATFQAMGEGIIAIDNRENITLVNHEAGRLLGIDETVVGRPAGEVFARDFLSQVLKSGEPELNQEIAFNGATVISNCVPIKVGGAVVGAVATLRDKTELNRLAEELTGVKTFIEALRVQNHEYMNKLHTIAGLIQLNKPDQALDLIFQVTEEQEEMTNFLTRQIREYSIAGLLLGKYSRAKELQINMTIDRRSRLPALSPVTGAADLVVILGNLLENAMDAVKELPPPQRHIYLGIFDQKNELQIIVRDSGAGIPEELQERIFERGVSTKAQGRGLGLYLVKAHLNRLGGALEIQSQPQRGTEIRIGIPKEARF